MKLLLILIMFLSGCNLPQGDGKPSTFCKPPPKESLDCKGFGRLEYIDLGRGITMIHCTSRPGDTAAGDGPYIIYRQNGTASEYRTKRLQGITRCKKNSQVAFRAATMNLPGYPLCLDECYVKDCDSILEPCSFELTAQEKAAHY